jgi:hypothetical protein
MIIWTENGYRPVQSASVAFPGVAVEDADFGDIIAFPDRWLIHDAYVPAAKYSNDQAAMDDVPIVRLWARPYESLPEPKRKCESAY